MKKTILCSLLLTALISTNATAGNYAECLLEKLPGASNQVVTSAAVRICSKKHPAMFYGVEYGVGLSIFGFGYSNPDDCTMDKAKDTQSHSAAALIRSACMRLYTKEDPVKTTAPWEEFSASHVEETPASIFADLKATEPPAISSTDTHYNAIYAAHPDADNIVKSSEFKAWISSLKSEWRQEYDRVLSEGSTEQVIAMLNFYKASGYAAARLKQNKAVSNQAAQYQEPQINSCIYKGVMTQADYEACGITPP